MPKKRSVKPAPKASQPLKRKPAPVKAKTKTITKAEVAAAKEKAALKAEIADASDTSVLTDKVLRFVDEYLVDFNASGAARRAGYSEKTAGQIGYALLKKVEIQKVITAKQKELAHQSGITRAKIVGEAARLAFSDVRKVFDSAGNLLPIHQLPDEVAAAISGIELVVTGTGDDVVQTKKIKFWDKNTPILTLLKHLGLDGRSEMAELTDEELDARIEQRKREIGQS